MVRLLPMDLPRTAFKKWTIGRTAQRFAFAITLLVSAVACVPSPDPQVQELVTVSPPSFNHNADAFISSPTQSYSLIGECDPTAKSTEYTFDHTTWTSVTCDNGHFTVSVLLSGYEDIWARSQGKFSTTSEAHARVRFLLPPTSDSIVAANSSKSSNSDGKGIGSQNIMSASIDGTAPENTAHRIQTMLPRMVYEK